MLTEIVREFKKKEESIRIRNDGQSPETEKIILFSKGRLEIKESERKINAEKGVASKKWRIDFLLFADRSACDSKEATSVCEMVDRYLMQED
jgi:hypothetical protein